MSIFDTTRQAVGDFLSQRPVTSSGPVLLDTRTMQIVNRAAVPEPPVKQQLDAPDDDVGGYFVWTARTAKAADGLPAYGLLIRDAALRDFWKSDSILSGAMASMVQKLISLGYSITGTRNHARKAARILVEANEGRGWSDFIAKYAQDFLGADRGAFTELGRVDKDSNDVDAIFHIDALYMIPRHDSKFPYYFQSPGQTTRKIPARDVYRTVGMPSPSDQMNSLGFCAVSRAAKAAKLLMTLHEYDSDKLSNMPPQGLAAISGMNERQMRDALTKYKTSLEQREQQVFPGVLWLASMTGDLKVDITEFSTLPDSFSRQEVVQIYVYTLALAFGVDAREFWPAAIAGATRADALVQAMKAKGKGPGELISVTERSLNTFVMPAGVEFRFDVQDDEEDQLKAEIARTRAQILDFLYSRSAQLTAGVGGEGVPIITQEEARRLAASWGIIPRDFVLAEPSTEIITDIGGFRQMPNPEVMIKYNHGIVEEADFTKSWFVIDKQKVNGHSNGHSHDIQENHNLVAQLLQEN